jgi:hypothetical protein
MAATERIRLWRIAGLIAVVISLPVSCSERRSNNPSSVGLVPDHLLVLVFDQMRPDYIDRFGLRNFQSLRASSRHYPEAYVGHLGSQTVVSHLVIPTGLLPKALPWQDDVMLDRAGTLGKPGAAYETGRLTREQFWKLLAPLPSTRYVGNRIRHKHGGKIIAVGEKNYAALMLGTPWATLATFGHRRTDRGDHAARFRLTEPR